MRDKARYCCKKTLRCSSEQMIDLTSIFFFSESHCFSSVFLVTLTIIPPVPFLLQPLKQQFSVSSCKPIHCALDCNLIQTNSLVRENVLGLIQERRTALQEQGGDGGKKQLVSCTSLTKMEPDESSSVPHMWTGESALCEDSWKIPLSPA